MNQMLLSRQDLAKRWNLNPRTIVDYEQNGIIKRVPKLQVPRYSLIQIEEIENAGFDLNPTSPIDRRRLEKKLRIWRKL
ncbi:transcription factor [Clostridium saccharoperbutylacetonicum]|uniref:transcription factor n=1 Tax=Clostridium saccharoperbutylacetonicum TaxID=36745 RepID=UPI0039EA2A79